MPELSSIDNDDRSAKRNALFKNVFIFGEILYFFIVQLAIFLLGRNRILVQNN